MLNKSGQTELKPGFIKLSPLADILIMFDGKDFDLLPENVEYDGSKWFIKSIEIMRLEY